MNRRIEFYLPDADMEKLEAGVRKLNEWKNADAGKQSVKDWTVNELVSILLHRAIEDMKAGSI